MAGMVTSSLGRFCAGALGLTGIAAAEPLLLTAGAATGLTLGGPAALGILGIIAAFAGGSAVLRGSRARRRDQKVDEAQGWLEQLIKQNGSLTKALAGLPEDAPVGFGGSCERLRRVAAVFADTDPERIAGRIAADEEFAMFIRGAMVEQQKNDAEFQNDLDRLIQRMLDAKQLGERQIGALNALDKKLDAIIATQGEHGRALEGIDSKIDDVVALLMKLMKQNDQLQQLQQENASLREQLREALVNATDAERAAGRSPDALLEELRRGDPRRLLAFLDRQVEEDTAHLVKRHRERAAVAFVVGEIDRAEQSLSVILSLRPDDPDAINRLGHIHFLRGALDEAERAYRRIIELAGDDEASKAPATGNLGNVLRKQGDLSGAEAMHREALAINERFGRAEGMATNYHGLGIVLLARGDLSGAEATHCEALAISERIGLEEGMAASYGCLGNVLFTRGDLDGAEAMHREALEIDGRLGRLEGMADNYGNLGSVLATRGDLDGAEAKFREALEINGRLGRLEGMATNYGNLGNVLFARGKLDEAEAMCREALEINGRLGFPEGLAANYGSLGSIYFTRGGFDDAERMFRKALDSFKKLGRPEGIAASYGGLSNVLIARNDIDGAMMMLHKAVAIYKQIGRPEGLARSYNNLGIIAEQRGDAPAARELWEKARGLYGEIGARHMVGEVQRLLDELPE